MTLKASGSDEVTDARGSSSAKRRAMVFHMIEFPERKESDWRRDERSGHLGRITEVVVTGRLMATRLRQRHQPKIGRCKQTKSTVESCRIGETVR